MNLKDQRTFKRAYDERDFWKCMGNPEFKKNWDAQNGTLEIGGQLAAEIVKGKARSKPEAHEMEKKYQVWKELTS
jgi:hypothetical protein